MSEPARIVGIIGLGIVGSRVADCVRRCGLEVRVWSRTRRERPDFVESPAAVAAAAAVIQIFVNDDAALQGVLEGLLQELGGRHIVVNCSTVSLRATLEAEQRVVSTGARFLDCPFTGSRNAAEAGELVYYAGGEAGTLEAARWALEPSAKAILPVGPVGHATVLKIATNMISATTVEVLAEAMGVVAAAGVPLEAFARAMEHNACSSGLTRMKIPSILRRDFQPHFSLANMWKDAGYALELAKEHQVPVPALAAARARMDELRAAGRGAEDYSVLAEAAVLRQRASESA